MLDLLLDAIVQGLGTFNEWTTGGLVLTASVVSFAFGGVTCWLMLTIPDPLTQPDWGFRAFAGCFVFGVIGLGLSLLHLIREAADEPVAYVCVLSNAAVVLLPTMWLLMR